MTAFLTDDSQEIMMRAHTIPHSQASRILLSRPRGLSPDDSNFRPNLALRSNLPVVSTWPLSRPNLSNHVA